MDSILHCNELFKLFILRKGDHSNTEVNTFKIVSKAQIVLFVFKNPGIACRFLS